MPTPGGHEVSGRGATREADTATRHRASRIPTYLLLAAGMALFGSATPVSKIVGEGFPASVGSGLRMVTAAVVLLPAVMLLHRGERLVPRLDRADWWRVVGIAAVGTVGFTVLLLLGLRIAPGAVASVVMATAPAVTAVGAVLFLHDRMDRWIALGIALAVAGVMAVNLGQSGGGDTSGGTAALWVGSLLVFGAVCCEAAYTLLGKQLTASLSPVQIAALAALLAALMFVPAAVWQLRDFDWSGPTAGQWVAVLWWGAGTMGLGSVLWFRGMTKVSGTVASGFMAVMPVSALVLSYVLLGEDFEWIHLVGMAGVLAGLAAITYRDTR